MPSLDNIAEIQRLDNDNILRNIQEFPDQCERCFKDFQKFALPSNYIQAKNIVLAGIGGSGIGGALVKNLAITSKIPIFTWADYDIPGFISRDSLVIVTSYSGNTEETVSFLKKAGQRTRKIVTISSGGEIESLSRTFRNPHYKIGYGSEPRAALGFLMTSILAILIKLDILEISSDDFQEAIVMLKGLQKKIDVDIPQGNNQAKILAQKLLGKIPIIYGAGIMAEVARRWKGQFNENAKTASYWEIIPELNHNSLAGLEYPKNLREKIFVIILESKFDHSRNRLRANLTAQILEKKRLDYDFVLLEPAPSPLSAIIETILLGDYVSYYLAILNNVEPNPIPVIKFLKDKLAEKPFETK